MIVTTTDIQNNFGKYLQLSQHEEIIITKNGKKIARLFPYGDEESMGRWIVNEGSIAYNDKGVSISYQEYLKLTQESENRYEYIDGEMILLAAPRYPHQRAVRALLIAFGLWFEGKDCEPLDAPFDVTLYRKGNKEKVSVVQPDILVICDQENINQQGEYYGTPALVVEVLSQSTRTKDMVKKLDLYMESGIQEYWVVNPDAKQVIIYVFSEYNIQDTVIFRGQELAQSQIYQGLEVDLARVF